MLKLGEILRENEYRVGIPRIGNRNLTLRGTFFPSILYSKIALPTWQMATNALNKLLTIQ